MNLSHLTSAHFRQILSLLDKKEALQAEIAGIESQVGELLNGIETSNSAAPAHRAARTAKTVPARTETNRIPTGSKRGELKEGVLTELKNAGETGLSVKELADKLQVKAANLHAWFGSTGKKIAGLKKIGPAKYSLASDEQNSL